MVLKLRHMGNWIRTTWEIFKYGGAGEGWKNHLDRSCENEEGCYRVKE